MVAPAPKLCRTWDIEVAAMLARIGLMAIPASVMHKFHSGMALTPRETDMILRVPEFGYDVLSKIPRLEPAAKIVLDQSKNVDGSGFPKGPIPNTQIPTGSRLLKILTDFVDLESTGVARKRAVELISKCARDAWAEWSGSYLKYEKVQSLLASGGGTKVGHLF